MGGDLLTGWLNNQYAEDRQNAAQNFSAEQYATRYQTTVKDMQAAGLNPMLAYTQAPGNSPGGVVGSSNATPSLGSSYNQSAIASAQVANIHADTANKEASADLIAGQAAQAWATAGQSNANVGLINATVDKVKEETKNLTSERQRLYEAAKVLYEQANLFSAQGKTEQFKQDMLRATAAKLRTENLISTADYEAIVKTGGLGRLAREVKPASDIAADWLSPSKWFKSKSESTVQHLPPMK